MRLISYVVTGESSPQGGIGVGELVDGRVRELAAPSMLAWLRGEGRETTGVEHELSSVELRAPVPNPPSYRDFMTYEGHVTRAMRFMFGSTDFVMPEYWYEGPVFYFSNPAAIIGNGAVVRRPKGVKWLDFELEIAAIIGANEEIVGFSILNDWSARDVQLRETTAGTGVHKAKDFATSLGPAIVTVDELPYVEGRLSVAATVHINGELVTETSTALQHFSFEEMRSAAARNTVLHPGDVIASGTLDRGCFAELGWPDDLTWLQPGDEVVVTVDGLGSLTNRIVEAVD